MISADHTERFYLMMPFSAAIWAQSFSSGWTNCSRLSISPEEAVRLCREAGIPSVNQSK